MPGRASARTECPDGAPEERIGNDAPCVEIEVRLQPLSAREISAGLIVFCRDRDQQTAGYRDARRDRRHHADDKHQPVAHLVRNREALRKKVELIKNKKDAGKNHKCRADLDIVAWRVLVSRFRISIDGLLSHVVLQRGDTRRYR